ncbi:unnamed protein product [Lasius platythorax]|uniref:arginine kinase n=2 Tax=Lasius TaxID=488720 RepID=A0A0J7KMK7_LASNI|nr:hypothetical protein RF55_8530 [Lasius niger]
MSTMFVPTWIGASQKKWVILIPGENTRIRCVKSIKGYPFNPAMSEIHCCELKRKVQEALTLLKEELKGTYYTLGALDKQIRQQLLDDHFLFNEGKDKQFLKAANQISTNE